MKYLTNGIGNNSNNVPAFNFSPKTCKCMKDFLNKKQRVCVNDSYAEWHIVTRAFLMILSWDPSYFQSHAKFYILQSDAGNMKSGWHSKRHYDDLKLELEVEDDELKRT